MRGAISKDGGNASSAGEAILWRAGCPSRDGIRRAWGEVPGRNQRVTQWWTGRPKVGFGRARTIGAKAFSFTHRTKVIADGTERKNSA